MGLDIPAVQAALQHDGLDGWLLYDFHGSNPIARAVARVDSTTKLTTRRWYYLIPATGEPRSLMHAIEPTSLAHLPGAHTLYAGHQQLQDGLLETGDRLPHPGDGVLTKRSDPLCFASRRGHR